MIVILELEGECAQNVESPCPAPRWCQTSSAGRINNSEVLIITSVSGCLFISFRLKRNWPDSPESDFQTNR